MPGRLIVLLSSVLCATVIGVFAQAPILATHSITGVVTDPSGAVLPGVAVELANPISADSARTATTSGDGVYRFDNVLPGVYVLTFRLSGFGTDVRDLELGGGGETRLDVRLAVAPIDDALIGGVSAPKPKIVCGLTIITPPNPEPRKGQPTMPGFPPAAPRETQPWAPNVTPPGSGDATPLSRGSRLPSMSQPRYTLRMIVPDICQ